MSRALRASDPTSDGRTYLDRPLVGVGAVIVGEDGRVVLVRRRYDPLAGRWSLPGGLLEVGETLAAGLAREVREETGLEVEVGPVIEVFDRIERDADDRVRYHYVLVDFLCTATGGTLEAASDVDRAVMADPADLASYDLTEKTQAVVTRGLELRRAERAPRPVDPGR